MHIALVKTVYARRATEFDRHLNKALTELQDRYDVDVEFHHSYAPGTGPFYTATMVCRVTR